MAHAQAAPNAVAVSAWPIVPFLYGEVVQVNHWLTDREFLDAVAVAMITPGPVVITVAFTAAVAGATFMVLSKWKVSELWLIAAAAMLGVVA